ncbi:MAG: AAA family ATPase [Rhodobacteraceae bacterium]|nr:AAA family ATPase [Paracoccaceae bacterium]
MQVTEIRVKNFKALQNVHVENIPGFAVFIGANGAGKTTLIDLFGFLKSCLIGDVRSALQARGGFEQVVSRGHEQEAIEIELKLKLDLRDDTQDKEYSRVVTYHLEIAQDGRQPVVRREILRFRRAQHTGQPYHFLDFKNGIGEAVKETTDAFNPNVDYKDLPRETYRLDKPFFLAVKALGQLADFQAVRQLRELIEQWTVSDFHIEDARGEPDAAPAEHLSATADNLALFAQYLYEDHREIFDEVVHRMTSRVPGVAEVKAHDTGDGRVVLQFRDRAFDKAFIARSVSNGTIKMFAYLLLLADPSPHPLLCVEEPENQLYHSLLPILAEEFAAYAQRRKGDGQVFVTTHSPDFLSSVPLESIYWLQKTDGYTSIHRAADNDQLKSLIAEGDRPGWLWREGLFKGVDPR